MIETPHAFPLIFRFRDLIAGAGFIAAVEVHGRLILREEESDGWTLEGVNPGGVVGCAEDREAAFADFRRTYQQVLTDVAFDTRDFPSFRAAVVALFEETTDGLVGEWETLRSDVREGDDYCPGGSVQGMVDCPR